MPDGKMTLLEARLRRRMRALGIDSFKEYCDFLFSPEGSRDESVHMIDAITTNKTDFFRESNHFTYLVRTAVPELMRVYGGDGRKHYSIWSAGCSTGEEPHTLAMVLSEFSGQHRDFHFSILATDISTRVLEHARMGIYKEELVLPVPLGMREKYLLRGKDRSRGMVRMSPGIRSLVEFRQLNFMSRDYGLKSPIHVIFCRNVLIYFDRATQERVLTRFYHHLAPGGYLFIGCSETLCGMDVPLQAVGQMVYRRPL